jgi:hypothetical protein
MKITNDFAPPLGLIAPFFLIGVSANLLSALALFWIDTSADCGDFEIAGWVHLFLLGYVVMVILGAMGQLIPVLLEKPHSFVQFFAIIPFVFAIGIFLMSVGFFANIAFLSYGAIFVTIAFLIYLADILSTLRGVERRSLSISFIRLSHIFLIVALTLGVVTSLGLSHGIAIELHLLILPHITLAVMGYIFATIVSVTIVLLPMFGLAHGFNLLATKWTFWLLTIGIAIICLFAFVKMPFATAIGLVTIIAACIMFLYQILIIYKKRVRKERDIWFKSLLVSFVSLLIALVVSIAAQFGNTNLFLKISGFVFFEGFLSFLISGHSYKIIPFLVWFQKYSPLVGKSKVPMLHEMVPKKTAEYQFWFSTTGLSICTFGIATSSREIWLYGVSLLVMGSAFLVGTTIWMLNFKGEEK